MAYNWSTSSWFTSEYSTSVEQDFVASYDVVSFLTDTLTPEWNLIQDGAVNQWFLIEDTIVALTSVTQDFTASYDITFSVYGTSFPVVTWNIDSLLGTITGTIDLPFASAEADASSSYNIYFAVSPSEDKSFAYRVLNYAEDTKTIYYSIRTSVQQDQGVTYGLGGYVYQDQEAVYQTLVSATADSEGSYRVLASAAEDVSPSYAIFTSPLSAGDNRTIVYQVVGTTTSDQLLSYNVLTSAELDTVSQYDVLLGATNDTTAAWDINGETVADYAGRYSILAPIPVSNDTRVIYNVISQSRTVPNIIGYSLSKAQKVLEQSGFNLGQVTYN